MRRGGGRVDAKDDPGGIAVEENTKTGKLQCKYTKERNNVCPDVYWKFLSI